VFIFYSGNLGITTVVTPWTLRSLWDISTPAIRSFGINQPSHPEMVQLGSMVNPIRLLELSVITASACFGIVADELIYWLVWSPPHVCALLPRGYGLCGRTNVLTAILIEMNESRGRFTALE
jgi:hypothetical protein